ncbi:Cell binding factor 2 precursor [hydrothermal vent metagenome]|uniref:Cell binding factor 2 n=1 Tax=hydrothermal vent metagenome TaxID=652676 RepID=A0A1W1CSV9_9ZZZZ
MKKNFTIAFLAVALLSIAVHADALKNSLTNFMNTKESSAVVDLGDINLNARPKPRKPKIRHHAAKATIATVNGHKIIKKDADVYLAQRTQGKIKNFDMLPSKQKQRLIREMALPILVLNAAKKELSIEEIQSIYNHTWMQKEARKVEIKDDEVRTVYNQIKQNALEHNTTQPLPDFEVIKNRLRSQMFEKRLIGKLMENVKIEVVQ